MKAAVLRDIGKMAIEEVPEPPLEPGGLLIAVRACAICGSDLRTLWHGNAHVKPPRILGHEVVGMILQVGTGVSGYQVGELVTVAPAIGCGECAYCRAGSTNMCANLETIGLDFDGGFAELMAVPAKAVRGGHVNKVPSDFPVEQAVLAEPLACCINGQNPLGIGLGQSVAVIGAGAIGLFHAELALLKGAARVFLADLVAERLEYVSRLGKNLITIDSSKTDLVAEISARTGGDGVDVAIVACPVGEAQNQALRMVRRRGRVSLFGGLPPERSTGYLDSNLIHYKEIGVFGAHASTPAQNRLALSLLTARRIEAGRYVTHVFPLERIMEGMNVIKEGKGLKVIIKP
ncbi:MAG: alcohol dehydrogenase catalytic domain-containing protein [Firmicutes bacterium]|nr:alcohol dehydrogenase catalytic domain-containing protein [Bacillota bacterium]